MRYWKNRLNVTKVVKYLLVFIVLLFTSCTYNKNIKYDLVIDKETKSILTGKILDTTNSRKNIYIILFKYYDGDKEDFKNYKLVDFAVYSKQDTKYSFDITDGIYYIYACQNLEQLRSEKYAYVFQTDQIAIAQNTIKKVDIHLDPTPVKVPDENLLIASKKESSILKTFGTVQITELDNPIFQKENGTKGLWNIEKFIKEIGTGLYILGDYDPNKKIVLFVHGMAGTPLDFSLLIQSLDKTKYLPMVYFYPSGINLNYSVDGLKYSFEKFKKQYFQDELIVVAHSVGGLVARGFISNYKKIKIKKFISISTPWNGNNFAQMGGDDISYLVPSFGNMIPGSAFIKNSLSQPLPSFINHYLLFSYKGKRSFILENSNDGVISLKSQLYDDVEKDAYKVYGFNETHTSILKSDKSIDFIKNIIEKE